MDKNLSSNPLQELRLSHWSYCDNSADTGAADSWDIAWNKEVTKVVAGSSFKGYIGEEVGAGNRRVIHYMHVGDDEI